jgi:hypothetical protein
MLYDFWLSKADELPSWHRLAMIIATLPTATGFVVRLISVFNRVVTPQQRAVKEDTIEARCIVAYNH